MGACHLSAQRAAAKILSKEIYESSTGSCNPRTGNVVAQPLGWETQSLTLDQALQRARTRAPLILAAQDRIEEARGRLLGAKVLLRDNPVLEFSGGPRYTPGSDLLDAEVGLSQSFELGGRRKSRTAAAQADVERETATSRNVVRELLRDVATAFWQSAAAGERVRVAQNAEAVANEFLQNMQRRFDTGDVPVLEVNVARNAAARTRAEVRASEAEQTRALGDLRILLGMRWDEPLSVEAALATPNQYDLDQLTAEALKRPDLDAISAELRQAEAEIQLGRGFTWPDLGLGFRYGRDEGDKVAKGSLTFSLPVFSRGQELRATGTARATRLKRELEATRIAIANEVKTAFEVQQRKVEAADELQRNAVQALDENESLARRSFDEGEINVLDLLVIRRDAFETRLIYLNQLLEAKLAAVDLEARAGVLK
jgi:outer membrane protein, heavy metal efflux system